MPTWAFLGPVRSFLPSTTFEAGSSNHQGEFDYALIFDCDGVIIETEELHRLAYNAAFQAADLKINGEPVE